MKVLIVGHGSIGKRHASVVRRVLPNADIAFLKSTSRGYLEKSHSPCCGDCFFGFDQVEIFNPTLAIISNPSSYHLTVAMRLAKANIPLLVEKPISSTSIGLDKLAAIVAENNLVFQVGYNLRYAPLLKKLKQEVCSNRFGSIYSIRVEVGQYLPSWRSGDYTKHVSASRDLGGGALLELSHEIDYLQWIFGPATLVHGFAHQVSKLEVNVDDQAFSLFAFEIDGRAVFASCWFDFLRHDRCRKISVICEKATLCWDGVEGSLTTTKAGSEVSVQKEVCLDWLEQTYVSQFESFLKRIRLEDARLDSLRESTLVMKLIDQIKLDHGSRETFLEQDLGSDKL